MWMTREFKTAVAEKTDGQLYEDQCWLWVGYGLAGRLALSVVFGTLLF